MASDVMRVRLHLRQIRVLAVPVDTPGELVVEVESTVRRPRCPACGFRCGRVHDTRRRKIRDLEVSGRRTTLVWARRRFSCGNCGERFLEDHTEFEGRLTRRLARRLVADAKVMTISAAARRCGLGWHVVMALVRSWSDLVAEHRRGVRCRVLLVDETSMRKRHRYVTVIVNGDTGQTLAMVQHRNSAALSAFLMQQGHRWCKGVNVVVSDGSKAYKAAIDAHLGHARHVLDRFHVIRWFSAGLTAVRRDVQRRPEGSKPAFEPEVFRARFVLLRRGDTLTDADRARLDALFDAHPRLRAGWQALQELHGLYLADDHDDTPRHAPENGALGGCVGDSGGVPVRDLGAPAPDGAAQPVDFCWHGGVLQVGGELGDGRGAHLGVVDGIDASEGLFGVPGVADLAVGVASLQQAPQPDAA